MKKLLLSAAVLLSCATVRAQTDVTVINNTNCSVGYHIYGMDMSNGGSCIQDFTSPLIGHGAMTTAMYSVTTGSYSGAALPAGYAWFMAEGFDHWIINPNPNYCPQAASSTCHGAAGTTSCGLSNTGCYTIITNCAGPQCPAGTVVNYSWNDNGPVGVNNPILTFY